MARGALMAEVSEGRVRGRPEVRLNGWCEGGFRQHRNDRGGCATMRERSERVESIGICITE